MKFCNATWPICVWNLISWRITSSLWKWVKSGENWRGVCSVRWSWNCKTATVHPEKCQAEVQSVSWILWVVYEDNLDDKEGDGAMHIEVLVRGKVKRGFLSFVKTVCFMQGLKSLRSVAFSPRKSTPYTTPSDLLPWTILFRQTSWAGCICCEEETAIEATQKRLVGLKRCGWSGYLVVE